MSIPEQQPSQSFAPHEAATLTGVSVHSIRRWCEYHAPYLSTRANPKPGVQRRLTPRDVEVMKHVKTLRDDGLSVNLINEKLAGLTFAEIDSDPITDDHALSLPDAHQEPPANVLIISTLDAIQRRLDAVEQAKQAPVAGQRDGMVMFGIGFVAALLLMLAIIGMAALYGGFR